MFLQQPRQSRPQRYSIFLPLEIPKNGGFYSVNPSLIYLLLELQRCPTYYALRKACVHSKPNCPPTSSSFCPHFTNSFCEQMKWLRPKKKDAAAEEKKTFFRRAKNFRAHAGKFLCAQKNIFVRTKIYFLPQGNFTHLRKEAYPPTQ